MSGSKEMQPEDDAEAVLKTLEESGVFDELRQQLLIQVKANVSFESQRLPGKSAQGNIIVLVLLRKEASSQSLWYTAGQN